MANEAYGRVWRIDTPGAGVLHPGPFHVQHVRWVAPAANPDQAVIIQDANGKDLWKSRANGPNFVDHAKLDSWWNQGFKVPTLDTGELFITVG
jgi:hypothetical protein